MKSDSAVHYSDRSETPNTQGALVPFTLTLTDDGKSTLRFHYDPSNGTLTITADEAIPEYAPFEWVMRIGRLDNWVGSHAADFQERVKRDPSYGMFD